MTTQLEHIVRARAAGATIRPYRAMADVIDFVRMRRQSGVRDRPHAFVSHYAVPHMCAECFATYLDTSVTWHIGRAVSDED